MGIAERVVLRVMLAKEFPTEDALREYLKQHPDADPARHSVDTKKPQRAPQDQPGPKKPAQPPPLPPQQKAKPKPPPIPEQAKRKPPPIPDKAKKPPTEAPKAPSKAKPPPVPPEAKRAPAKPSKGDVQKPGKLDLWKARFKGLSDSASSFVEKSPKAVKHFFGNDEFRKNTLTEAKSVITKSPKKIVNSLVETAKEEVHEFKTASIGVKNLMTGKKMSKKQKAAFKSVATHMAIAGAAAAFAATGPLAGAGVFAGGLAKHVALKSVHKSLGNLHLLEELGHVGHGVAQLITHIAAEDKDKSSTDSAADEAMAKLVLASVAKEIESLTDEDFSEVLNSIGDEGATKTACERVVARYLARG